MKTKEGKYCNNHRQLSDIPSLNDYQQKIVDAPYDRHMCVIASAGSGKTFTMIHRIAKMITDGIDGNGIVAVCFNRDAARSGRKRLEEMIGENTGVMMRTVDSFAKKMCEDTVDRNKIPDDIHVSEYIHIILEEIKAGNEILISRLRGISHLFFDEFQDIDCYQQEFVDYLVAGGTVVCCIGDDSQCINEWRHAEVKYIREAYQKYDQYSLPINYRSTRAIVALANEIVSMDEERIKEKMPMEAAPDADEGGKPIVIRCHPKRNAKAFEFEYILDKCKMLLEKGVAPTEIAVLIHSKRNIHDFFRGGTPNYNEPDLAKEIKKVFTRDDDSEKKIRVMTIHASKGLEFDYVFMARMSKDYPWYCNDVMENENRRVFYVGATRAKKQLIMTFVEKGGAVSPTRYIKELSGDNFQAMGNYTHVQEKKKYESKAPNFERLDVKDDLVSGLSGKDYRELREAGIIDLNWEFISEVSHQKKASWGKTKSSRKRFIGSLFDKYMLAWAQNEPNSERFLPKEPRFVRAFKRSHQYAERVLRTRGLVTQREAMVIGFDDINIKGVLDAYTPNRIHELKFSVNALSGDFTVQLLCYVALMRLLGERIDYISLYNGMTGTCYAADVSNWNCHEEFLRDLMERSKQRQLRTFVSEN